jgi:hypothetical protein
MKRQAYALLEDGLLYGVPSVGPPPHCCLRSLFPLSLAGFDYGLNGAVAEFPAVNCSVVVAHRQVNCSTSAGAGYDMTWVLTIGDQTSQAPVTSYGWVPLPLCPFHHPAPSLPTPSPTVMFQEVVSPLVLASLCSVVFRVPEVTALEMGAVYENGSLARPFNAVAALSALSTEGGEVLLINGTNLGPAVPRSYVSAVWYTNGALLYSLNNCTFLVPHRQFQCVTVPGVGFGHLLQVLFVCGEARRSALLSRFVRSKCLCDNYLVLFLRFSCIAS